MIYVLLFAQDQESLDLTPNSRSTRTNIPQRVAMRMPNRILSLLDHGALLFGDTTVRMRSITILDALNEVLVVGGGRDNVVVGKRWIG